MRHIVFIPGVIQNYHLLESAIIVNERVPIRIDFDRTVPPVGFANLSKDETGRIYAEIKPSTRIKGLFPYIGGIHKNGFIEITDLGIGVSPNADINIKPIL